jgi:hypothetical protein
MGNESRPAGAAPESLTKATAPRLPQHEPSAWLRGAAAQRVRQIEAAVPDPSAYGAVVAPLGRTGPPGSREDRECDRCRSYVPEGDLLHLFTYQPTPRIHLAGGLCGRCAAKERAR